MWNRLYLIITLCFRVVLRCYTRACGSHSVIAYYQSLQRGPTTLHFRISKSFYLISYICIQLFIIIDLLFLDKRNIVDLYKFCFGKTKPNFIHIYFVQIIYDLYSFIHTKFVFFYYYNNTNSLSKNKNNTKFVYH